MKLKSNTSTLIEQIKALMAEVDAQLEADTQQWLIGRRAALKEFKLTEMYTKCRKANDGMHSLYRAYYEICGGKTWFNVINNNSPASAAEFVTKNCKAVAEKRAAKIAAKLTKAGITNINEIEVIQNNGGFDGIMYAETDAGTVRISINTIYAGGYNIQCAHVRVLCNVKKVK